MKKYIACLAITFHFAAFNLSAQTCDLNATESRRTQVDSISKPLSYVVQLTMKRGRSYNGTAFFIHPRVLLTAGHNLRKKPQPFYTRVKSVTLRVGATGPNDYIAMKQYKTSQGGNIYTLETFNAHYSIYEDYGIIILPDNELYQQIGGNFKLTVYDSSAVKKDEIKIAGYPGDKDYCTLWTDKTTNYFAYINPLGNPNKLAYLKYDFYTETGLSGGPVWFTRDNKNFVFAIHTYGNNNDRTRCNTATLITQEIFNDINRFCKSKGIDISN